MPVPVNSLPKPIRRKCTCLTCQRTKTPKPLPTPTKVQGPQRNRTTTVKTQVKPKIPAKTPAKIPRVNTGFDSELINRARSKTNAVRRSVPVPVPIKLPGESPWKVVFCCPVCSQLFQEAFKFRILMTECGHRFCSSCLYRAHLSHPICPTCNRPVDKYNFKRGFD